MLNVRILGPFPPPFGGVAIHCIRLLESLNNIGIRATGYSLGGLPAGVTRIRRLSPAFFLSRTLVHYHTDEGNHRWMRLLSRYWRLTNTPYVVTVHSFRNRQEFSNPRILQSLADAFRGAKAVIAISNEVANALESLLGFTHIGTRVIPSNLPLSKWELNTQLPSSTAVKWQKAPIRLLANAGRVVDYQGKDLYGLDVLVEAFSSLTDTDIELCIAVGEIVNTSVWQKIEDHVSRDSRITVLRDLESALTPFVKHSHIVIRPTRTEGGLSLTISEALELGRWAIGSDAVERPQGTVLFRNEDAADLARAIHLCVSGVRSGQMPPTCRPNTDTMQGIQEIYTLFG